MPKQQSISGQKFAGKIFPEISQLCHEFYFLICQNIIHVWILFRALSQILPRCLSRVGKKISAQNPCSMASIAANILSDCSLCYVSIFKTNNCCLQIFIKAHSHRAKAKFILWSSLLSLPFSLELNRLLWYVHGKQECIPVGCVPPTSVAISPACTPSCHICPLPCIPPAMHATSATYDSLPHMLPSFAMHATPHEQNHRQV